LYGEDEEVEVLIDAKL
jgi:hypothetical protein